MAEDRYEDSLAAYWAQLAVLAMAAWFVALFPAGFAGAVVCERIQERFRAIHGFSPDGLGCAVPGAATWSLCGAILFAVAVWWGSGRGYPPARLRLGRSMLGVASAWFVIPAVAFIAVAANPGSAERAWVLCIGLVYLAAVLSAVAGAWRGRGLVLLASTAAAVLAAAPTILYPVHEVFGVAVATPIIAPGLGLALAAALTSPRLLPGRAPYYR